MRTPTPISTREVAAAANDIAMTGSYHGSSGGQGKRPSGENGYGLVTTGGITM